MSNKLLVIGIFILAGIIHNESSAQCCAGGGGSPMAGGSSQGLEEDRFLFSYS